MAWLDVVPYLMSHFATVREAVAYVHSDAVQVRGGCGPQGCSHTAAPLFPGLVQLPGEHPLESGTLWLPASQPPRQPRPTAAQVTTSQPPMPFQRVLRSLGLGEHEVPVHLALHDAAGEAALIEFTSEGVGGWVGVGQGRGEGLRGGAVVCLWLQAPG